MGRPVKDLRGKRYGKLLVVALVETRKGRAHWDVVCDCGAHKVVNAGNLQSGLTRSCGNCANEAFKVAIDTYRKDHG